MKSLVLKNKMGQVIRVFRCEAEKIFLIYRKTKGRLEICSSPDFFEKERDSILLIDQYEVNKFQSPQPVPLIDGFLEVSDELLNIQDSLPRPFFDRQILWKTFAFVSVFYLFATGLLYWFSNLTDLDKKKKVEQQLVKIIKPPVIVKPEKVVLGSEQMFIRKSTSVVKKKILKRSLKKMGALSALGSLSKKDTKQRGGLNLGANKVSAGPGLRSVAGSSGSGGVQDSLYSKGMITAALGSGGNIRGGGGYGVKGTEQGGGSAGYGELSLVGSGGSDKLSFFSVLDSQGGSLDFSIIEKKMIEQSELVRKCYGGALKLEPNLKGLSLEVLFPFLYRTVSLQCIWS